MRRSTKPSGLTSDRVLQRSHDRDAGCVEPEHGGGFYRWTGGKEVAAPKISVVLKELRALLEIPRVSILLGCCMPLRSTRRQETGQLIDTQIGVAAQGDEDVLIGRARREHAPLLFPCLGATEENASSAVHEALSYVT
jgi:hypothetical protein